MDDIVLFCRGTKTVLNILPLQNYIAVIYLFFFFKSSRESDHSITQKGSLESRQIDPQSCHVLKCLWATPSTTHRPHKQVFGPTVTTPVEGKMLKRSQSWGKKYAITIVICFCKANTCNQCKYANGSAVTKRKRWQTRNELLYPDDWQKARPQQGSCQLKQRKRL